MRTRIIRVVSIIEEMGNLYDKGKYIKEKITIGSIVRKMIKYAKYCMASQPRARPWGKFPHSYLRSLACSGLEIETSLERRYPRIPTPMPRIIITMNTI